MPQYLDASRSKLSRGRMEKTAWRNHSRLYIRCFFFVATFAFWLVFLVFHFSLVGHSHVQSAALSALETLDSPLFHPSQKKESLRSRLNQAPEKLSSRIIKKPPFSPQPFWRALSTIENKSDPCAGKYVYMHDLPPQFNQKMLEDCRRLSLWTNMCKFTANAGLGPPLEDTEGVFSSRGWYATNQFSVDVIFHNRMKQYECLTNDSGKAAVVYVPFYAGLDISRHLWGANVTVRDSASLALAKWLQNRPEWKVMGGRDHFLVGGRITWDFRRLTDNEGDWGNKLLEIPAIMNMSMLVVESSPFHTNDFGIPYPTYFHPSQDGDVLHWQKRVRTCERPALFSFAGAPRPEIATSIRGQIMDQCKLSESCKLLECDKGESKCHSPSTVMKMFQESVFCLQPQGDSFTRRSIFDSMVAGCIPVFFHPDSAYSQYIWHLPHEYSKYSVFIPEDDIRKKNVSIEKVLLKIPPEKVEKMREGVISLIPGVVYADPRHKLINTKDAFDITVQALIDKVTDLRIRITEGREEDLEINEGRSGVPGKADLRDNNEQVTRRWEGQRRNGEEGWSETSPAKPLQSGKIVVNNGKESNTGLNSLEEIWRRDQAEKEARRRGSANVVTQESRFPNRESRKQ